MHPSRPTSLPRRQRGAALVTGLLIMIVMTLIGIAAMESSIIQTNLATNSQLNTIGFQTTEATLARAASYTYLSDAMANRTLGSTLPPPQQPIQISIDSKSGKTVNVTPNGQVDFCGTLRPDLIEGLSLDADQSVTNNALSRYVFDLTAATNVGGQASTQHTQRSSRLMLSKPDEPLCNI